MTKKLILFDVDDTIIDHSSPKSTIPEKTRCAISKLQEQGHYVGLATGRSEAHIHHIMELLNMTTAVSFSGHLVVCEGREIFRQTLDREELDLILKDVFHTIFPAVCITEDNIYVKDFFGRVKNVLYNEENVLVGEELVTKKTPLKKLDKISRDYLSMMVFKTGLKKPERFKKLEFNPWGNKGFEIYSKGISKLSGIKILAKELNVSMEDIYVFGDNYNDIHMLKNIKNSVAVGNGVKEAKKVASYVSPPINEGGILTACIELGLLEDTDG